MIILKHKRTVAAVLAVTLVLSIIAGYQIRQKIFDTEKAAKLTGVMKAPADGVGNPGVDFKLVKTGQANDWGSVPVPKINPLGSHALYEKVQYLGYVKDEDAAGVTLHTLDGYTERCEETKGEQWVLTIPAGVDYSLSWMRWITQKNGGKWYDGTRDHSTVSFQESDTVQWWADVQENDKGGAEITVVKTNTLLAGKTITVRPADYSDGSYTFYTDCASGSLQSATVKLKGPAKCGVKAVVGSDVKLGEYQYQTDLELMDDQLNLKKTDTFVLDNLPVSDKKLRWRLSWGNGAAVPDEISIHIEDSAKLSAVKWGEAPGAIRVTGIPMGEAKVSVPEWAKLEHSEVDIQDGNLAGVADQNGDLLFAAPSGYYNVSIPSGLYGESSVLRFVPVSAGEVTTVTIPAEMKASVGAMSRLFGDFETNEGGIELLSNKSTGNTGTASFVLNDPQDRNISPAKEDVKITEDGVDAAVTKIEREPAGSDVVLVLDSSGSMGENMKPCVEAAKQFVKSLPGNSSIQLIQFAQQIIEHKGTDKAAALKSLDSVKAGGGTSLYDATARALTLLEGKKRGYAVVFSDGADSREPDVDGDGSSITREQAIEQIKKSGVTVLTIGFGKACDTSTLVAMSGASKGGAFFAASDKNALKSAFASVAGQFGNQFTATYTRPTVPVDQSSAQPVVSMMIDRSGSMDADPAEGENVGWRLDKIKAIFHNFVQKLPQGTLMQAGSFACPEGGEEPRYDQITTDRKAPILQAIGSLKAGGGTPALEALSMAYSNLSSIPSQKRVLVYFTDAGLYDPEEPEVLDDILSKYKNSGIRILFAGLSTGADTAVLDGIFKTAAGKAGGDYILTDSVENIAQKLDELLNRINTPAKKAGVDFTLNVDCKAKDGSNASFATAKNLADFTPLTGAGKMLTPQAVGFDTGEPYVVYDRSASQLLTGSDQPGVQSRVLLRLPFSNKSLANKCGTLTVHEAYLMDVFKGISAPAGQAYLALDTELAFKKDAASGISAYQVPDIFNHFYVSVNSGRAMPASEATWLAEQPFAMPGESSVQVSEKEPRRGALVFLVDKPSENCIHQLSLHLYDTENGHIELPLAGSLTAQMLKMDSLPTQAPAKISSAFSLAITGKSEQTKLEGVELTQAPDGSAAKNVRFRVLDVKFDTKVQALLEIDPTERLYYQLDTDRGALLTPMSDIVYNLPLGFSGKTMLAPGSCSHVRMPFTVPNALLGVSSSIFGDLASGSLRIPVTGGSAYKTGSDGKTFSHKYFDLTVNSFSLTAENSGKAVLDFTLTDKKDGEGTAGLESVLLLQKNEALDKTQDGKTAGELQQAAAGRTGLGNFTSSSENTAGVNIDETERLIFGAAQENGSWAAFDGQSRRGLLIFDLPEGDSSGWTLTCGELPDMRIPLSTGVYPYTPLLAEKPVIVVDSDFEKALNEAVTAAVTAYGATRTEPNSVKSVGLSDDEVLGNQVPSPSLTLYGSRELKNVKTDSDFAKLMGTLKWIPGDVKSNTYRYAPEAVLTQGWGAQNDLSVLAKTLLARLGYQPQYRSVTLTPAGTENLKRISGAEDVPEKLTGVAYADAKGSQKLYVPALNGDISELFGLCYLASGDEPAKITPAMGRLTVELYGKLVGNAGMAAAAGMMSDIGSILGGGEGGSDFYETVTAFDRELSLPDMSLDTLDISYISTKKGDGGELLLPVLDTRQGLLYDPKGWIDSSSYEFKSITIKLNDGSNREAVHTTMLNKEQKLTEVCHALAWNVPELTAQSASPVEAMAKAEAAAAQKPANYSVARWLGHETIGRLVKSLSDIGQEAAQKLKLTAGRTTESIALLVTMKSDGKKAETTVDLMNHRNQLHNGSEQSQHAYNLIYGYFASDAEASALPGKEGVSYTDVWSKLPEGTNIGVVAAEGAEDLESATAALTRNGCPSLLLERLQQKAKSGGEFSPTVYLVPSKSAEINGKQRWAWLEIDTKTYDVVSVFDTGERAGMGEYLIGCFPENYAEVGVGAIVGVTTSLASVSAYSLSIDDYGEVRKAAFEKCKEIGEQLGTVTGAAGGISAGGKVLEGVGGTQIQWEKLFEAAENQWVNRLTFDEGYKLAVEAYFGKQG